jgi:hypothetical protein
LHVGSFDGFMQPGAEPFGMVEQKWLIDQETIVPLSK